jgi:hypothetical protein
MTGRQLEKSTMAEFATLFINYEKQGRVYGGDLELRYVRSEFRE